MKAFKPLLAEPVEDPADLRFPLLCSPKLDGIRCVKRGGKALTRKLLTIPNKFIRSWVEANLPEGIDGELMLRDRKIPLKKVTSAIMSHEGEPDFVFHAFDLLTFTENADVPFSQRLAQLEAIADSYTKTHPAYDRLKVVLHTLVEDAPALDHMVRTHLAEGYEGTMVRDPMGRYKFGRSTVKEGILLKIKPYVDEEATVVGVVEQMHNTNEAKLNELGQTKRSSAKAGKVPAGKLGTLVCVTEDGAEFEIGTGFTDAEKVSIWNDWILNEGDRVLGRLVKFKHQPPPGGRPAGVAPRGPVFLGWRED